MRQIRRELGVMVVGAGLHTQKNYLPYLAARPDTALRCIVELEGVVDGPGEVVVVDPTLGPELEPMTAARLDAAAGRLGINAVLVSTTPEAHEPYLRWAISRGLHTLVDKPVLAYANVSNDPAVARRLRTAFDELQGLAARRPDVAVAVAVQRRHHPAHQLLAQLVEEAAAACSAPITALASLHADGQFRTPAEIATLDYHGYRRGMGKQFHSGMHIYDLQAWLIEVAAAASSMSYSSLRAHAEGVRPNGFLEQFPPAKLDALFGTRLPVPAGASFDGFGELDIAATTAFLTEDTPTLLCQTTLLHNSFSRRSWAVANADLYKKNGRVKHEQHTIEQGPMQAIHFRSYQASDDHDHNDVGQYAVGGNNHMEITVFRNAGLWPYPVAPMTIIGGEEIAAELAPTTLAVSQAKTAMLDEFFDCASGRRAPHTHRAALAKLALANTLLSSTTESLARGGEPVTVVLGDARDDLVQAA